MIDPKTFKYHLYKDDVKLTSVVPFVAVARSDHNGNYSCKAEGIRDSFTLSKESQTIHIKAKGKSSGFAVLINSTNLICVPHL